MTREEFLEELVDILQTDEELSFDTVLDDIDEWDSLSKMAIMAFLNKEFNCNISFGDLKSFVTVNDIAKKVGI